MTTWTADGYAGLGRTWTADGWPTWTADGYVADITPVQWGGVNADSTTSISRAFGSNVTSGNLLVVVCAKYSPNNDTFVSGDLTKSAGTATIGTPTLDAVIDTDFDGSGTRCVVGIFSVLVTGTGSLTLQVAGATAGSYLNLATAEFSSSTGWDSSRVEDTSTAQTATDGVTAADSGNADSAGAALFVGGLSLPIASNQAITEDAAFSRIFEEEDGSAHNCASAIRRIVSTGTTDSASWTVHSSALGWAAAVVVYKAVVSGAATQPSRSMHQFRMRRAA